MVTMRPTSLQVSVLAVPRMAILTAFNFNSAANYLQARSPFFTTTCSVSESLVLTLMGTTTSTWSFPDRFFRQHIDIWLNDGKGRFVKSLPGRFSPDSGSDLAFVAVDLNCAGQPTVERQRP